MTVETKTSVVLSHLADLRLVGLSGAKPEFDIRCFSSLLNGSVSVNVTPGPVAMDHGSAMQLPIHS